MGGWNSESHLGAGVYVTKRRNNRRGTHHCRRVAHGSKTLRTTCDSRRHWNANDTHPRWTSPRHASDAHNHIRRGHPARVLSRITPFCISEWIHLDIVESTQTDAKSSDSSTRPGKLLAPHPRAPNERLHRCAPRDEQSRATTSVRGLPLLDGCIFVTLTPVCTRQKR